MAAPLRGPAHVAVSTGLSVNETAGRLRTWVDDRPSIELAARASSDRRVVGSVTGAKVALAVRDAHLRTRRKSWNIEFIGTVEQTTNGATLSGTIDIPDRQQLHLLMWLFRVAAALEAIFWAALTTRDAGPGTPLTLWPIISAVVALALVVWVTAKMEDDGQRAAAEDAHLLTDFLNRSLV